MGNTANWDIYLVNNREYRWAITSNNTSLRFELPG